MENKTIPLPGHHEPMADRAEWITPAIMDYDIEEATRNVTSNPFANDGTASYS